jgi:hypothetical protein
MRNRSVQHITSQCILAYLLKASTVEPKKQTRNMTRTSRHYGRVLRRQLEEYEVGVTWPPACEDVSPGAEERSLLEDVSRQRSEDRDREH